MTDRDFYLITGASGRDREVLCDDLGHDERYDRLEEHAAISRDRIARGSHSVSRTRSRFTTCGSSGRSVRRRL